jgi:DNA-binding transcriptional ArsR family regulator
MLEKIFGRTARTLVLENLIEHNSEFTHLSGIARETGLSHSSVARVIEPLVKNIIVVEKGLGRQVRTFALNEESSEAKLVIKLYHDLLEKSPKG